MRFGRGCRAVRGRAVLDRVLAQARAPRGLRGIKLVISDAHEGIKAAVAKVLHASWQRCRVHFMRNVLAHAGRQGGVSLPPSSHVGVADRNARHSAVHSRNSTAAVGAAGRCLRRIHSIIDPASDACRGAFCTSRKTSRKAFRNKVPQDADTASTSYRAPNRRTYNPKPPKAETGSPLKRWEGIPGVPGARAGARLWWNWASSVGRCSLRGTKQMRLALIVLQRTGKILAHKGFLSEDFKECTLSLTRVFGRPHRRRHRGRSAPWRY